MKKSFLILGCAAGVVVVSIAATFPPDYDDDFLYVRDAPEGLTAEWAGDDVYISWDKAKDKFGNDVTGYRLYRAANADSAFVMLNVTDDIDNDIDGTTDEQYELILPAYYMDTSSELTAAGIYQSVPFYYKVTALVLIWETFEDIYLAYEGEYSLPVEIEKEDVLIPQPETDIGCFIATAAFGSPLQEEVRNLSAFRDNFLSPTRTGKVLVNLYYRLSPEIANFLKDKPSLKAILRPGLTLLASLTGKLTK